MADLGMYQTAQRSPVDQQPGANARADRQVAEAFGAESSSPAMLGNRRSGDIRVKRDGHAEPLPEHRPDGRVLPARFRGRGHVAPGRRIRIEIDGAERADADRGKRPVLFEERHDPRERRLRRRGPELFLRVDLVRPAADRAYAPGPTGLNSSVPLRHRADDDGRGPGAAVSH